MFNLYTKHVHKLKQCINLILHDENYASFVVSLLVHKMGGGGGSAYFKSQQIGRRLLERDAYSRGRVFQEGALFLGFTVYIFLHSKRLPSLT